MIIRDMEKEGICLDVTAACSCLDVSRSGYVKWMKREEASGSPNEKKAGIRSEIHGIAAEFSGYGYRRITAELHRRGIAVNHKRVLRVMREDGILCIRKKAFHPVTTDSSHSLPVYPNLAGDMCITGINQLWVADITYIGLARGFIYLAVIIDVFSRKCIGWELDRRIDTRLVINALSMALSEREGMDLSDLVHHSDRGVQYACWEYVEMLARHGIRISMSRKGNPYDNAFAESFMKTLKYECVYLCEYNGLTDAYNNIGPFIEEVYNKKRLHSSIGYITPDEFEKELIIKSKVS